MNAVVFAAAGGAKATGSLDVCTSPRHNSAPAVFAEPGVNAVSATRNPARI
jgi:hypothetical protein